MLSADVTVANELGASAGLVVRHNGAVRGSYYLASITGAGNGAYSVAISRVTAGVSTTLASAALPDFSGSGNIRFAAFGSSLKVYVDGSLKL